MPLSTALQYQYRDRKRKKREARKLWIQQINAATRQHGVSSRCSRAHLASHRLIKEKTLRPASTAPAQIIYSKFIHTLSEDNIKLDRKILSELAMNEPYSFKALVDRVKFMRGIE